MDKEELEKLFDTCDVAGNGYLDKSEFARLCQELSLKDDELQSLFRSVDINKDGMIQKYEFVEKFYVVADLFFSACDVTPDDVNNLHCDVTDRLSNGLSSMQCNNEETQHLSEDNDYFNDVTKQADVTIDSHCDVIAPLPEAKSFSAPLNESSFMVTPPAGDSPGKRTSTPRPGAIGGRVSRSGRFKVAKGDKSWDAFAESVGNVIYSLSRLVIQTIH